MENRKTKTIHINSAKLYVDRVTSVSAVTVLTDDPGLDKSGLTCLVSLMLF